MAEITRVVLERKDGRWHVVDVDEKTATTAADKLKTELPAWAEWTPEQMRDYVRANVTDLATAIPVLENLAYAVGLLKDVALRGRLD